MFKSLVAKAIVPVALSVTGFVIVCCILLYSVIKNDMFTDTVDHETSLADTVIKATRYAMLKDDREALRNIVNNIGGYQGVEHVRIFNKKGLIMFSAHPEEINRFVDKKAEGCFACHSGPVPTTTLGPMQQARSFVNERNRKVLAITAPIYNEPECYNAACHFHTSDPKLLGTLDIGFSEEPLQKTLSLMRHRMTLFSIMVLILTVGGVSALLRRNVFVPIQILTEFTELVARGDFSRQLPNLRGDLGQLAASFQQMALDLDTARSELEKAKGSPSTQGPKVAQGASQTLQPAQHAKQESPS